MTSLADRVRQTFTPPSGPIVALVSGGGDSVALAVLLHELGLAQQTAVLHVNHMLRGAAADGDEQFVSDLAGQLGMAFHVERIDVAALAGAEGRNVEETGRHVRYAAAESLLDQLCAAADTHTSLGRILTAHTRDDRVETFFARAIAGAGTGALGSIRRQRGRIVRPLLDVDRAELRSYLAEVGHSWREDESNQDTSRERAFIRHNIVPAAEALNPSVRSVLARTMDLLAEDDALLQRMADAFARDFADDWAQEQFISLNLGFLKTLEPTMVKRTVRTAISKTFSDASRLDSAHVARIADAVVQGQGAHDLPGGIRAEMTGGALRIRRVESAGAGGQLELLDAPLAMSGITVLPGVGTLELSEVEGSALDQVSPDPDVALIDAGSLLGTLSVGPVREGERMTPLGMEGSKKLSDIFVDAKVPQGTRRLVPVVRDGRNVVWVAGTVLDDRYRVSKSTVRALRFEWRKAGE